MHVYECFIVLYMLYRIRIILMCFTGHVKYVLFFLVFTWYVEYVFSACLFLSCFIYLCLVRNDLINMFKQTKNRTDVAYCTSASFANIFSVSNNKNRMCPINLGYCLHCASSSIKICEQVKQKSDCDEENRINFTAGIHAVRYIWYIMQL